jgi:neutral ceramidase
LKKLLATCAALAALLLLVIAALSLLPRPRRHGPARLASACRGSGALRAGAAAVPLDLAALPGPLTIAGFARLRWGAVGQRDPLAARALVIAEPGCAVGLVSLEILLVPEALARAVERQGRDLGLDQVIVAATHTHAGPGGYWDSALGGRLATAPYDPAVLSLLSEGAARALRQAQAALAPARLSAGVGDGRGLVANRDGTEVDGRLVSVRLSGAGGEPIGELALLGSHPTMLGMDNRLLSGDWPGALMRSRPALLFFQGALGDQTTHAPGDGAATPEAYAGAVAARLDAVARSAPDGAPPFGAARAEVPLPPASPGAVPALLRAAAGRLFSRSLPGAAAVVAVRLGPLLLLATPAEPTARVAAGWREAAGAGAEVLSLAGPYAGYVEAPERMARGEGETARTYYGPELAARLGEAAALAGRAARGKLRDGR